MGKTYPTTSTICGLDGKRCKLTDYPKCDDRTMRDIRPIPEQAPTDNKELQKWVNHWVDTVKKFGGICSLSSGMWAVYYKSLSAYQPQARLEPKSESKPASESQPPFSTSADTSPIESKDGASSFDPLKFVKSVQEFGESLIPEKDKTRFGIISAAATVGIGLGLAVGLYVLYRKRGSKPKAAEAAAATTTTAADSSSSSTKSNPSQSPNIKTAEGLQRMLAVYSNFVGTDKFDSLSPAEKIQTMFAIGNSNQVTPDPTQVRTLAMEYDALLGQIEGLKELGGIEGMKEVDAQVLARALFLERYMMIVDGTWDSVESNFTPGNAELMGPIPPDWIVKIVKERGWGIGGKGDPFAEPSAQAAQQTAASSTAGATKGSALGTNTASNSLFWNQVITSEWFQGLDNTSSARILDYHVEIQAALQTAYGLPEFKARYLVKDGVINEDGLQYVVVMTLDSHRVDTRGPKGLADLARPDEKRDADWMPRYREMLERAVRK